MTKLIFFILFTFVSSGIYSQTYTLTNTTNVINLHLKQSKVYPNWNECVVKYEGNEFIFGINDANNDSIFDNNDYINIYLRGSNQQVATNIKDSIEINFDTNKYFIISNISKNGQNLNLRLSNESLLSSNKKFIFELPDIDIDYYLKEGYENLNEFIPENKKNNIAVYFWSSSCKPCVEELHLLKELKKRGYFIINFCAKKYSDVERVKKLISSNNVPGEQFIGGNDKIGDAFNQTGFPQLIIFKEGQKYPLYFRSIEGFLNKFYSKENK